jgi:tetratricopeptide (TPR) repeat protein
MAARSTSTGASRLAADLDLLRRKAGLSFRELARRADRPPSTVGDALGGRRFPRLETVLAVVRACGEDEEPWRVRWIEAGRAGRPPAVPAPAELPHEAYGFAGREAELDRLEALRSGPDAGAEALVIAAIDGMAGVGKTALALRWAHRIAAEYPDGRLFLDLRGHHRHQPPMPAAEALEKLLRSLGAPPERVPADTGELARRYRSVLGGRRVLVVLDDATSADQVRPLLPAGPGCLVIVTSRRTLAGLVARDGAHRLLLGGLTTEQSGALLGQLLGPARVEREPAAAADLARACGHLPLALRIAAAHLATGRYAGIGDLVRRMCDRDRLGALTTDDDAETGVRVAFDLSYRSLDEGARRLLRHLGLIPGADVDLAAAAALVDRGSAETGRLVDTLATAHLVEQHLPGRYQLHDLLRAYAAERAEADETPPARLAALSRLLDWYLHKADAAARRLYPDSLRLPGPVDAGSGARAAFCDESAALAWLEAERANLVAAIGYAADHGPYRVAPHLADTLRGFFNLRLYGREWFAAARAGLRAATRADDPRARAAMHHSLGLAHSRIGENSRAVEHFSRAQDLYRDLGNVEGRVAVLICQGGVYRQLGQVERAAHALEQSRDVCRRHGLRAREGASLGDLGEVYRDQGRLAEAARCQQRALAIFRDIALPRGEALALLALGAAQRQLGRTAAALDCETRALALLRAIGSRDGEAYANLSLALVYNDAGRSREARRHADVALAVAAGIGDDALLVEAHLARAAVLRRHGAAPSAARHDRTALRLARRARYGHGQATALVGLAASESLLGRWSSALAHARRALTLSRVCGYRLIEDAANAAIARIRGRGHPARRGSGKSWRYTSSARNAEPE